MNKPEITPPAYFHHIRDGTRRTSLRCCSTGARLSVASVTVLRLLGWVMAGMAMLVLLIWLSSTVTLWWATDAIASAQARKAKLEAEVAEMQANRDAWAKAGMLGKLERCDPGSQPCIRVDTSAPGHTGRQRIAG